MAKYLLNFLFVFLLLSSLSFAQSEGDKALAKMHARQAKLQKEFGYDLMKAPFYLRFAYLREFGKDWKETDYAQRLAFLTEYQSSLAAQEAKDKEEARADAAQKKQFLLAKKEAQRKERDRLKALAAEEKLEKMKDKERQKQFDEAVKEERKELKEMQREATQNNN